jgi:hypothetical protein
MSSALILLIAILLAAGAGGIVGGIIGVSFAIRRLFEEAAE